MSFTSNGILTLTIPYYKTTITKIGNEYELTYEKSSINYTTNFTNYIPANFVTLALRKSKIGINKSDLQNVEEALYIAAKNRVDSGNKTGNIAIYGSTGQETYPHVFSIQGNSDTKMPNFNKATGEQLPNPSDNSTYMGFYNIDENGTPYRIGSFGMEKGYPYFVYKGRFYTDSTAVTYSKSDGSLLYTTTKQHDNKNYFEKINLASLGIPIGTIMLFPTAQLEFDVSYYGSSYREIDQSILDMLYPSWYICNGNYILDESTNGGLINFLYRKKYKPNTSDMQLKDLLGAIVNKYGNENNGYKIDGTAIEYSEILKRLIKDFNNLNGTEFNADTYLTKDQTYYFYTECRNNSDSFPLPSINNKLLNSNSNLTETNSLAVGDYKNTYFCYIIKGDG